MTSEMIERVAEAIRAASKAGYFTTGSDNMDMAKHLARAAIEAMREPTNEMTDAAFAYYGNDPHPFADEWRFMIDAALK